MPFPAGGSVIRNIPENNTDNTAPQIHPVINDRRAALHKAALRTTFCIIRNHIF